VSATLRGRLSRLRAAAGRDAGRPVPSAGTPPEPPPLAGWERLEPWVHARSLCLDLPPDGGRGRIELAAFSRGRPAHAVDAAGIAFFDLETTGLSGGTGTVAFLAAIGRIDGGRLRIRQFFMADYPGEPGFLAAVKAELCAADAWSTYNGSSFDLPLLRTRCVMNGEPPPPARPHADALHPARRLWRETLPDCSLGTVERLVLGMDRGEDLPGADIPEAWFRYLREGPHRSLELALEHNASDVLALARTCLLVADAARGRAVPLADPLGAAELQARVDPDVAERSLLAMLELGDRRAVRPLMKLYWKAGRRDERLALSRFLPDGAAGDCARSIWHERALKDVQGALELARKALADPSLGAGDPLGERLARRVARLERLAARTASAT